MAAVACLLAFAPAAAARISLPRNSVGTEQIGPKQVLTQDLARDAVRRVNVADGAIDGTTVLDQALSGFDVADDSLRGSDIDETTLDFSVLQARLSGCDAGEAIRSVDAFGRPTCVAVGGGDVGALGGDLTGTLPNPTIANDAVTSAKVAANALSGSDIDESTLGTVPSATTATSAGDANLLDGLNSTDFVGAAATAGGDLGGTFSNLDLVANAVDSTELSSSATVDADRAVTTNSIKTDAITAAKVLDNDLTGSDVLESSFGIVPNADQVDGIEYSAIDSRLDSLCTQADTINQEVRDLRSALDIPALTDPLFSIGLDLSGVVLPDFDPAPCQG